MICFSLVRGMATEELSVDKISGVVWDNSHDFYMGHTILLGNHQKTL